MSSVKRVFIIAVCLLVITASAIWIYLHDFKAPKFNVALHQRIGEIMAEETARVAGGKGHIVIVAIDRSGRPELDTQIHSFKTNLNRLGKFDVRNYEVETKDQPKYGLGSGLSGRRYARIVGNNRKSEAIVSFIGAPNLEDEDLAQLTNGAPKLIAETRSYEDLPKLFENKLIDVAIVSRFSFPSPVKGRPKTAQEWFDERYQIVTSSNAATIPKPTD